MKAFERLPLGLTITPGRPRLNKLLEGVADRTAGSGGVSGLTGVVVGVCGPPALGSSVGKAVRGLDGKRRKAVGGVELHEECASYLSRLCIASLTAVWFCAGSLAGENKAFSGYIQLSIENRWMLEAPTAGNICAHVPVPGVGGIPPASRSLSLASTTFFTPLVPVVPLSVANSRLYPLAFCCMSMPTVWILAQTRYAVVLGQCLAHSVWARGAHT